MAYFDLHKFHKTVNSTQEKLRGVEKYHTNFNLNFTPFGMQRVFRPLSTLLPIFALTYFIV